jgi:TRAP-type C4-dicarboxylate transport system permease small subunit
MFRLIRRIYHSSLLEYICGGFLVALLVVCLIQEVTRYFLVTHPWVGWTEELSRLFFVWGVFWGAVVAVKKDAHLGVDIIVNKLPGGVKIRMGFTLFKHLFMLFIAYLLIRFGYQIFKIAAGDYMTSVGYPRNVFYMPGFISGILMVIYLLPRVVHDIGNLVGLKGRDSS